MRCPCRRQSGADRACLSPALGQADQGSVELAWHATGIIRVERRAVRAGRARGGEVSQRRDALGPASVARLPQIGADERLRAMLEGLLDRNHNYRRGLLAVDSKTLLEVGIDADPGPADDPLGLV